MARRSEDIDYWVGQRISQLRRERGLSQTTLASALGLSFQQVQKYETGANRVSAARLYRLSLLLECSVAEFFPLPAAGADSRRGDAERIVAAYRRIGDAGLRRSVLDVVQALAPG